MKIIAAFDESGRILAAIVDDGRDDSPRPMPGNGVRVGSFDLPLDSYSRSLEEICTSMRVDPSENRLAETGVR